jgi:hypothetical protein
VNLAAIGKKLHLRLFLEGIEVPVIAASVSVAINAPASASIQVIPLDSVMKLHARTMVHLFYIDSKAVEYEGDEENTKGVYISRKLSEYKLLFAGEMIAYQFQQTPASRAVVLQCLDFSSYWDTAHATALEYGPGGNAFTHTSYVQNSTTALFDDIINQHANRIVSWLNDRPNTPGLNTVSGLAGGVIRMMEAMGGVPNVHKGINDFFTVAELRTRFMEQITAEENDNTASNLMYAKVFDEWLRNGLQNIGQDVTFRDLMKLVFTYIYYELVPNPTARFREADLTGKDEYIKGQEYPLKSHPYVVNVREQLKKMIANAAFRGNMGTNNMEQWTGFFSQMNRFYLLDMKQAIAALLPARGAKNAGLSLDMAITICNKNLKVKEGGRTNWEPAKELIPHYEAADKALEDDTRVKSTSRLRSTKTTQRLHSQILRPDCWFSAPPVCNVIFPEHYVTLAYERNFLGETTRCLVQLYNTLIEQQPGGAASRLLSTKILAPNYGQFTKSLVTYTNEFSYQLLMDHELHTGIVPREDWVPNTAAVTKDSKDTEKNNTRWFRMSWGERVALFNFFKYRFANRQASVAGRFNPNVVCGFPAAVIRAPYYPHDGDRPLTEAEVSSDPKTALIYLSKRGEAFGAPVHLIGMVGSVSHNIDQSGGTTSITMHHVRHHMGDEDEFLRIAQEQNNVKVNRSILFDLKEIQDMPDGQSKTDLLAYLKGLTPQNPIEAKKKEAPPVAASTEPAKAEEKKTEVKPEEKKTETTTTSTTTTKTTEAPAKKAGLDSVSSLIQNASIGGKPALIPTGSPKITRGSAGLYGKGIVKAVRVHNDGHWSGGSPSRCYQKVEIIVEYEIDTDEKVPAEEIFRPRGWFSPKYANSNIGKEIYTPFFGCQSVLDQFSLGDSGRGQASTVAPAPMRATEVQENNFVQEISTEEAKKVELSIETSLNTLAYFYGKVKTGNGDVEDFIQQYTHRSIATMEDILGSEDMAFTIDKGTGKATLVKNEEDPNTKRIGFHTQAVHTQLVNASQTTPLAGLVSDLSTQLSRMNDNGTASAIPGAYDIRFANQQRVIAYAVALRKGKAFIG